jgi:hypothetical protein
MNKKIKIWVALVAVVVTALVVMKLSKKGEE